MSFPGHICTLHGTLVPTVHLLSPDTPRWLRLQIALPAMGKVRFDRRAVRHSSAALRPSMRSTRKKRAKPRGMKTRILGLVKGLKEFLLADTYMYGPVVDPRIEAAIYQCREDVYPSEGPRMEADAGRLAERNLDGVAAGGARKIKNNRGMIHQAGAAAVDDSDDVGKSKDSAAHEFALPQQVDHRSQGDASPISTDVATPKGEVPSLEPDKLRKEPVRVRLHKITRTKVTHTTAVLATKDRENSKRRETGGDAEDSIQVDDSEDAEGEAEGDEDTSLHDSVDEAADSECSMGYSPEGKADFVSLDIDEAAKVVQQIVDKFGGRYSEELGIDVDRSDAEVERWFLACVLFNRRSSFDPSPETLQKLQEGGLQKISDAANWKEADLARLWEGLRNPELCNPRSAARLHKLIRQLHTELGGNISALKNIGNYEELHEAISKLYGVGPSTANAFLRELRGAWPGASPELGTRSLSALRHLRLVDPNLDVPYSVVCSCLKHIANQAKVDFRDVEAALIRFGQNHARNYRRCQGGLDCETWTSIPQRTTQRHYKFSDS